MTVHSVKKTQKLQGQVNKTGQRIYYPRHYKHGILFVFALSI